MRAGLACKGFAVRDSSRFVWGDFRKLIQEDLHETLARPTHSRSRRRTRRRRKRRPGRRRTPTDNLAVPVPVGTDPFPIDCQDFDLTAQFSGKAGALLLPGGRTTFTGPNLRITLTGPTGKTVTYVITGATHVTELSDGSFDVTATGLNTIIVPFIPDDPATSVVEGHDAGLFFTSGTMSWK